ncbi:MAG: hypothetical protein KAT39_10005, partial [Alphaproteobacteria bacterium]|nr:hypothetical protein [Alphaproteobacteria bacterium]
MGRILHKPLTRGKMYQSLGQTLRITIGISAIMPLDASATPANPILVEITRGPIVESRHRGSAAVVDITGKVT